MQSAVSRRTPHLGQILIVAFVLLTVLTLGGIGGYVINNLTRTVPAAIGSGQSQISPSTSDYSASMTRHAATERAEADAAAASDSGKGLSQFKATERATNPAVSSAP